MAAFVRSISRAGSSRLVGGECDRIARRVLVEGMARDRRRGYASYVTHRIVASLAVSCVALAGVVAPSSVANAGGVAATGSVANAGVAVTTAAPNWARTRVTYHFGFTRRTKASWVRVEGAGNCVFKGVPPRRGLFPTAAYRVKRSVVKLVLNAGSRRQQTVLASVRTCAFQWSSAYDDGQLDDSPGYLSQWVTIRTRVVKSVSRALPVGSDLYLSFGRWEGSTQLSISGDLVSRILFDLRREEVYVAAHPA